MDPSTPAQVPAIAAQSDAGGGARDVDKDVAVRRRTRIVFGAALIPGALVVLGCGGWFTLTKTVPHNVIPSPFVLLPIAWGVAFLAAAKARAAPSMRCTRLGDDDLFKSIVLPLVGLALIVPATVLAPLSLVVDQPRIADQLVGFSVAGGCVAQLTMCCIAAHRTAKLLRGAPVLTPFQVYLLVVASSILPIGWYYLLTVMPTVVIALPLMGLLRIADRLIAEERRALT